MSELAETILKSRDALLAQATAERGETERGLEAEGGCGVIGFASSVPMKGKYLIVPCGQMRNRGNGKGGGIAAAGCFPKFPDHYALHIAYLERGWREQMEGEFVDPVFDVAHKEELATMDDYREVGLEIEPPRVVRYFVRVRESVLAKFAQENGFKDPRVAEDELVFQNSFRLNSKYYGSREDKKAFVLSHGRNMMIIKAVGYAEDIARYYLLDDFEAHVWIGHQRYPTRGRVWHPGGAHPFSGLDEALVHNGDFANYYGVSEYLKQRNYYPNFMTDTEVAVYLFDMYNRVYGYPLEYIIEALGPTTERDFNKLPAEKREVYRAIQRAHLHGSPDGPWFFIIARNDVKTGKLQLIGITDTSMLRPQVFALQQGEISIGAIASEKQAIDALLTELSKDDPRVCPVADRYWNARGGSYNDGGSFIFSVGPLDKQPALPGLNANAPFMCTDKFGREVTLRTDQPHRDPEAANQAAPAAASGPIAKKRGSHAKVSVAGDGRSAAQDFEAIVAGNGRPGLAAWSFADLDAFVSGMALLARKDPSTRSKAVKLLTLLNDRRYHTGKKRRSAVVARLRAGLDEIFRSVTPMGKNGPGIDRLIGFGNRGKLVAPGGGSEVAADAAAVLSAGDGANGLAGRREGNGVFPDAKGTLPVHPSATAAPSNGHDAGSPTLFIDCTGFQPEGDNSAGRLLVNAYKMGWKRFVVFGCRGDRFIGVGLGPRSDGVRIDVYGSPGDYLGSGLDGAEIHVHTDAQDQVGQILKSGKLVIHGMVGQTFLYGAKGGVAYVLGNAAGRPLINAVGNIRAIINGTALDYAAESFMAGGTTTGGFLVINAVAFDEIGKITRLPECYPGGNFFSLASGGAGYLNDPDRTLGYDQLNAGKIVDVHAADWRVIEPYLKENEEHFGIQVSEILQGRAPAQVYRKVIPERAAALAELEDFA